MTPPNRPFWRSHPSSHSPSHPFCDRAAAGQALGQRLFQQFLRSSPPNSRIFGLPRGGIPVAYEIALALGVPLDAFLVRKLGVPNQPELAMGAIASGGIHYLNSHIMGAFQVSSDALEAVIQQEQQELERRESLYRQSRPAPVIQGQHIIVVDDGIATGASMIVALLALRTQDPRKLTVAVPVAARSSLEKVSAIADDVVCLICPDPFDSVGQWYLDFTQVSDTAVCDLLMHRC
ncbi:MAG: phosphoribosyltransferase [Thermosynechococcaceae cyanobacterium MS004]|nr:phosphoribosyltransferase [Thermosynechococcaceae cyanobacterium MS004]